MKSMTTGTRLALAAAALVLGGCAAMRTVSCDVSSYGDWPADRKAGSYAFERLPSQEARKAESEVLEASARGALAKAGFKPAEAGQAPELIVQLGARDDLAEQQPWDNPIWWRGGYGYWRPTPWLAPRWTWGTRGPNTVYERQVALLIRDRASGKPLFEARASSEGFRTADAAALGALFEAALTGFPKVEGNPHRVDVMVPN